LFPVHVFAFDVFTCEGDNSQVLGSSRLLMLSNKGGSPNKFLVEGVRYNRECLVSMQYQSNTELKIVRFHPDAERPCLTKQDALVVPTDEFIDPDVIGFRDGNAVLKIRAVSDGPVAFWVRTGPPPFIDMSSRASALVGVELYNAESFVVIPNGLDILRCNDTTPQAAE
jgi:hypothetical protein